MRQKKSGIQIGDQLSSDLKPPTQDNNNNPNFNSYKLRISHLRIQIPTNYNEIASSSSSSSNPQIPIYSNHERGQRKATSKLFNFTHVKLFWIKLPPRVLIILCLPPIYFFSSHHYRSLYLYILFVIALSGVLLSFINSNAFHPSIIPYIPRNFKFFNVSNSNNGCSKICPPVVWSIGSKTRFEELAVSGFLVKVYSNGDVYEGEFYKGKCSGSGIYYYHMNGRYEGDWVDQKYDGFGVETWAKGSRYRGQYRNGLRHGYGVYRFYTGDMYHGEWFKGQCHGCGVHSCEDGSKYCGEFKGGLKHGLGYYHFRNGDTYVGEYFADKMQGFGVYSFANGHRYEGAWHEGKRQGFGLYMFKNGDTQSGEWENGLLRESSTSVSHAKVVKAVQEARRIAEKAMVVADVEERVNSATAAANRAANAARVAAVKALQSQIHHHD